MNEIVEYTQELTDEENAFLLAYLQCFNATQATKKAGIVPGDAPAAIARDQGYRMMVNPAVMAAIERHFALQTMSASEALHRLTEQARCEYAQYIESNGTVNLAQMEKDNKLHLIKSIKKTKYGLDITFVDSQIALAMIAKHHGLLENKANDKDSDDSKPPTYIIVNPQ